MGVKMRILITRREKNYFVTLPAAANEWIAGVAFGSKENAEEFAVAWSDWLGGAGITRLETDPSLEEPAAAKVFAISCR